jgi:protein gp37
MHVDTRYYEDTAHNAIGWCCRTHNLLRGCSPAGPECDRCYAATEGAHQNVLRPEGAYKELVVIKDGMPRWTARVLPAERKRWVEPFQTRRRWLVFANSMSDPFHHEVPDELVLHFFRIIHLSPWHVWQAVVDVVPAEGRTGHDALF